MIGWHNVVGHDQVRHARRLHARQLRHLVAGLPDVRRRAAQRHQPALRNLRQRRRRHASSARCSPTNTRAPGTSRIRRCRRRCGRSATTTTTNRPACSLRCTISPGTSKLFLQNFYLKCKRSILKAKTEGPAAYVFPADDPRRRAGRAAAHAAEARRRDFARDLVVHRQRAREETCRIDRRRRTQAGRTGGAGRAGGARATSRKRSAKASAERDAKATRRANVPRRFVHRPHGPAVQPHRRLRSWTISTGARTIRSARRTTTPAGRSPSSSTCRRFAWPTRSCSTRRSRRSAAASAPKAASTDAADGLRRQSQRRHRARDAALQASRTPSIDAAEEPFDAGGKKFTRGSFIIRNVGASRPADGGDGSRSADRGVAAAPSVKTHPVRAARIAILHTWQTTQTEGWWRQAFDLAQVPYTYISTQQVANDDNLNAKFDVHRVSASRPRRRRRSSTACRCGATRCRGRRQRRRRTSGPKIRPTTCAPASAGRASRTCRTSFGSGGLLVTSMDTADLAVTHGLHARPVGRPAPAPAHRRQRRPIEDGGRREPDRVRLRATTWRIWCDNGPIFNVSSIFGRARRSPARARRWRQPADGPRDRRRSGHAAGTRGRRGTGGAERVDVWQAVPITDEQLRNGINVIPPRGAAARDPALRRHTRAAGVRPGRERRRNRAARRGRRRAARQGARRRVFEQPDLARRDPGQLLPGLQRAAELRPAWTRGGSWTQSNCGLWIADWGLSRRKPKTACDRLSLVLCNEVSMARLIVATLVAFLLAAPVWPQQLPATVPSPGAPSQQAPARDNQPKTGTARIRGHVFAADNGTPLRRAQVRLFAPELREQRVTTTDEQGDVRVQGSAGRPLQCDGEQGQLRFPAVRADAADAGRASRSSPRRADCREEWTSRCRAAASSPAASSTSSASRSPTSRSCRCSRDTCRAAGG